ncbi:hypothetical protein Hamer_G023144, partial [Homarus americanus]
MAQPSTPVSHKHSTTPPPSTYSPPSLLLYSPSALPSHIPANTHDIISGVSVSEEDNGKRYPMWMTESSGSTPRLTEDVLNWTRQRQDFEGSK